MDLKVLATVFGIVFLAELGDKTQLAIGVVAGGVISQYVSPKQLSYVAGAGFLLIGAWTIWQGANLN